MDPCRIIVAQSHAKLLDGLRHSFAKRDDVEIILDRRGSDPESPESAERRGPALIYGVDPFLVII